ncbi:MAG: hypothetical protein ABIG11_08085 [bacterium]
MDPLAANGLIPGDPAYYHTLAFDLADRIKQEGWNAWSLRPSGQGIAGITAALYVIIIPKPWMIIPLNAFLHALASVALIAIINRFFPLRLAVIASLLFILSPYEMHWFSQLNKDSFVAAGFYVFVYGWLLALRHPDNGKESSFWPGLLLVAIGTVLMAIVRPFLVAILWTVNVVTVGAIIIRIFRGLRRGVHLTMKSAILRGTAALAIIFPMLLMTRGAASDSFLATRGSDLTETSQLPAWEKTEWMPLAIDRKLLAMARLRDVYRSLESSENNPTTREMRIDSTRTFQSAHDFLTYIPRALQIALFAPFPKDWIIFYKTKTQSVFRIFVTGEMIIAYLAFFALVSGCVVCRARVELFIPLAYAVAALIMYGLATPFIGTLYRYRYSFFMLPVALGIAFGLQFWTKRSERSPNPDSAVAPHPTLPLEGGGR